MDANNAFNTVLLLPLDAQFDNISHSQLLPPPLDGISCRNDAVASVHLAGVCAHLRASLISDLADLEMVWKKVRQ